MFSFSIESLPDDQVKITIDQPESIYPTELCEVLLTAANTLKETHPHILKSFFFCSLEVIMEDQEMIKQLREILTMSNNNDTDS